MIKFFSHFTSKIIWIKWQFYDQKCYNYIISTLEYDKVSKERKKVCEQIEQLEKEINQHSGKVYELKRRIEDIETELDRDYYKMAKTQFRKKLVEKCARDKVINDLNKYYMALDWSITRYYLQQLLY